jgi:hypothetical protein
MTFHVLTFVKIYFVSIAAGTIGSLLGLGGGIIVIPVLASVMGFPIRQVIGASLISVIATSSGSAVAYVRDRLTNLRVAMFLELATTSGALAGAWLSLFMPARLLFVLFGVLVVYSAGAMYRRRHREGASPVPDSAWARRLKLEGVYHDESTGQTVPYRAGRLVPGFLIMWWAGAVSGILGIGSGIFKVVGMDLVMGLPIKISSATSNFMMGVTAAAGAGVHFAHGDIDPSLAGGVALGVLTGALIGSKLLPKLRDTAVRRLFIPVLLVMGIQMIYKGLHR